MYDICPICRGYRWVCEAHPFTPWNDGECCGAPGVPCACNRSAQMPPGFEPVCEACVQPQISSRICGIPSKEKLGVLWRAAAALRSRGGDRPGTQRYGANHRKRSNRERR